MTHEAHVYATSDAWKTVKDGKQRYVSETLDAWSPMSKARGIRKAACMVELNDPWGLSPKSHTRWGSSNICIRQPRSIVCMHICI